MDCTIRPTFTANKLGNIVKTYREGVLKSHPNLVTTFEQITHPGSRSFPKNGCSISSGFTRYKPKKIHRNSNWQMLMLDLKRKLRGK